MNRRRFSLALLEAIRRKERVINEGGLDILVKPIPDEDRPGAMDPRLYAATKPLVSGLGGLAISLSAPLILKSKNPRRLAAFMRRFFNDVKSLPLAAGVEVRHETVRSAGGDIPVRLYRRLDSPSKMAHNKTAAVLYYIHGGGFAAGNPDVVEEMVKQVVSLSGCAA